MNSGNGQNYTLLVDAGGEYYKREMLHDLHNYAKPLVLLTKNKITWERQYIDDEIHVESYENETVLKAVTAFLKNKNIRGVLTYNEDAVPVTAFLSSNLNVRRSCDNNGFSARNKYLMRSELERNNVPSAKFSLVHSVEDIKKFAAINGYPAVLKPAMGGSSIAVIRIDSYEDALNYFDHVLQRSKMEFGSTELLIEEYLDGKEVSVESVVCDGEVSVVAITDKFKSAEPFFEEIGHIVPSNLSWPIQQGIKEVAVAGMKALGIRNGVTHSEIKVTSHGPKIVEIGARPAGGFIPTLVELSTGVNLSRALVDVCLGKDPDITKTKDKVSAVRFIIPKKEGVLFGHSDPEQFKKIEWIKEFEFVGALGNRIMLPPNKYYTRLGHYIIEANDRSEAEDRIKAVEDKFILEIFEGL